MENVTQEDFDKLKKDFEEFKNSQKKTDFKQFEDIKFYPQLKVDKLYVRVIDTSNV
ncbi:hypothetical protein M0R04_12980 [Candidatus Dojkabacteria bacterium]|jgi:hypothetical protein|nr:hypothetical protein [Candidatus Dojkabacteria bacterium]